MTKRLRVSINLDKVNKEQASLVLAELGEFFDYNVDSLEVGDKRSLQFGGESVGNWTIVEVDA